MAQTREEKRAKWAAYQRKVRAENPETRDYHRRVVKEWKKNNPEKVQRQRESRRTDPQKWATDRLSNLKKRAHLKGVPVSIDVNYILSIIPPDMICPALGVKMEFGSRDPGKTPSIDRIRPECGYVPGNLKIICLKANILKRDCVDPEELRKIASYMEREKNVI